MLLERVLFPFTAVYDRNEKKNAVVAPATLTSAPSLKTKVLGLDFYNSFTSFSKSSLDRAYFEEAPYDFDKIIEAIDTDSYAKQAFFKYKELFWKEGWDIVSENSEAVNYLLQRIDYLEYVMKRPFQDFLMEIADQLVKFANVFIVEVRQDITDLYPDRLYPVDGKDTIAGYYIIPTETVKIYRDKFNKPIAYRQKLDLQSTSGPNTTEPTWKAEEVIHLYWDKKPGRPFGTPFIASALDDIVALRQVEEDAQNLVHRELSPLYVYTVGTEDKPSTPEEIVQASNELEGLRTEGGIILPERHKLEVLGAEGNALDIKDHLSHFKERVAIGLGVFPHHLGMMSGAANRSVTDRLDTALYDKIKLVQSYLEDTIRLFIFNTLLHEGGFDPMTTPQADGNSDRCFFRFREIDIDTQIKKENHVINKYAQNTIDLEEARMELHMDKEYDLAHFQMTLMAHVQTISQMAVQQNQAAIQPVVTKSPTGGQTTKPAPGLPKPTKPDAQNPSTGILPNMPNKKKGPGNISKPSNQFGRKLSPNIRHMDENVLNDIVELLEPKDEEK